MDIRKRILSEAFAEKSPSKVTPQTIPPISAVPMEATDKQLTDLKDKIVKGLKDEVVKSIKDDKVLSAMDLRDGQSILYPNKKVQDMRWHGSGVTKIIAGSGISISNTGDVPGLSDVTISSSGSGTGTATVVTVNQTAHGFTGGEVIRNSGVDDTYVRAQADSAAHAEVVGIVTNVINANNFEFTTEGLVVSNVPVVAAGTVYFLSASVAGALTTTEPSTAGQVSKPLAIILESGGKMLFENWRGEVLTSPSSPSGSLFLASVTGVDLTAAGTTTLFTVPAGKTLFLQEVYDEGVTRAGFVSEPTVSVGISPTYDQWLTGTLFRTPDPSNFLALSLQQASFIFAVFNAGDVIKFDVRNPAVAASMTANFYLFGFYV